MTDSSRVSTQLDAARIDATEPDAAESTPRGCAVLCSAGLDSAVLLAEEMKYRLLVKHSPAITYITAIDEQSSMLYTSPQIATSPGRSPPAPGCFNA